MFLLYNIYIYLSLKITCNCILDQTYGFVTISKEIHPEVVTPYQYRA